ncbi:MAG: hypothetical protein UY40_C0004G0020 [candidate division CPR1 bacterium GW2011_GWC1_49_13]|uniref:Uncharacterized protein n=1 Tax=candidate division CPR1 bacterium GW2011_GWC1_49_13 TaxID=1618342 RepID=A0A0G1VHU9_9BACT|nr:MAG: hypothetical protein UY40_C0004G0020 [candidate division CPR1 bacterium GW2011_GWC1_49_13]
MIEKDFKIDFKSKRISYIPKKGATQDYKVQELYSFLMDTFDEPENMKYDIPMESVSKGKFRLVNGWKIDEKAKKRLKGGTLEPTK